MTTDARIDMNSMYRLTRHIYDATRKYYLLGRDHLIQNLNAQPNENICEVGCGTARNLIKLAERYPDANFYGLDASDEMLKTAQNNLKKTQQSVILRQAFSQSFDPQTLFTLDMPLDKIIFSYALSIIPPWQESIDHALTLLPKGGELHIVDFGDMNALPKPFANFIFWWLKKFHVYHKPEIMEHLKALANNGQGTLETTQLYRGYAYIAVFKKN